MINLNPKLVTVILIQLGIIAASVAGLTWMAALVPELQSRADHITRLELQLAENERRTRWFLDTAKDAVMRLYHCSNGAIAITEDNLQWLTTALPDLAKSYKQELARKK